MTACALITYAILEGHLEQLPYLLIVLAAVAAAGIAYMRSQVTISEATARYDALLSEYRKLKREARNHEEAARIEERTHIARRIHDSVGHKLTSLLMQLETFRMQADGEYKQIAEQMKRLAQDSLQETRSAVKALKEEEPGGMQALLRLIRNLEAESYMQVEFVVRHGALSVVLDNDQSAAVYRSIQEALTNAMRHGSSRKVNILLESPGGSIFRFEVTNETSEYQDAPIREGFGLTAMRERVESAGGTLEIARQRNKFVVRGTFVLSQP
jgi:signal transduction histidine kinase